MAGIEWSAQEQTDAFGKLMGLLVDLPNQKASEEAHRIRKPIPSRCVEGVFRVLVGSSLADTLIAPGTLLNELFLWLPAGPEPSYGRIPRLNRVRVGSVPTSAALLFNPSCEDPSVMISLGYANNFEFHTAHATVCIGAAMTTGQPPQVTRLSAADTFSGVFETCVKDVTRPGRPEDIEAFAAIAKTLSDQLP